MQTRSAVAYFCHVQTLAADFLHVRAALTAEPDLVYMPLYKAEGSFAPEILQGQMILPIRQPTRLSDLLQKK